MIATWVRQDPAFRSWWKWACFFAGNIILFLGIGILIQQKYLNVGTTPITWGYLFWALLIWEAVMTFVLSPLGRRRCNPLAMGLPVPAQRLWLAHTVAVLLGGVGLVGLSVAIVAGGYRLAQILHPFRSLSMEPGSPVLLAHLVAGVALAVAVLQNRESDLQQIPFARRHLPVVLFCVLGIPILILALSILPGAFAGTLVVPAAVIGIRRYRSLPRAFTVAPAAAVAARHRPEAAPGTGAEPIGNDLTGLRLYSRVYRILTIHPLLALMPFPFLIGIGLLLSDLSRTWLNEEGLRFTFVPIMGFMLMSFLIIHLNQFHMVDGLPVSRRRMFAMLMVPMFMTLALGYGAGNLVLRIWAPAPNLIDYRETDSNYYLYVPFWACRIAWDGNPPYLRSPWGEAHLPASTTPLLRGASVALYTPFSTPPGSSIDFVALQMSRAIEALYGRTIPYEELRDRYLESAGPGRTVLKSSGFNLMEDYPDLAPVNGGPLFPVLFLGTSLFFFLFYSVYMQTFRAGVAESSRKAFFILLCFAALGIHMAHFVPAVLGWVDLDALTAFYKIAINNLTAAVPGGALSIWLGSAVLFGLGYLFTQSRFLKIEAPVVECKKFWLLGV